MKCLRALIALNYSSDRIASHLYNPTDQSEIFDPLSNDLNADSNFLTRQLISRYMVKEDINDRVSSFNEKFVFYFFFKCPQLVGKS